MQVSKRNSPSQIPCQTSSPFQCPIFLHPSQPSTSVSQGLRHPSRYPPSQDRYPSSRWPPPGPTSLPWLPHHKHPLPPPSIPPSSPTLPTKRRLQSPLELR